MPLTLVQRFQKSISTLLPYEQILFVRHFSLREVRKSEKAITVQSKMAEPLHFYAKLNEIHTGCGRNDAGVYT